MTSPKERYTVNKRRELQQTVTQLVTFLEKVGHSFAETLQSLANFCTAEKNVFSSEKPDWEMTASLLQLASELATSGKSEQSEADENLALVLCGIIGRSWRSHLDEMVTEVVNSLLHDVEITFADILLAFGGYATSRSKNATERRDWETIAALLQLAATVAVNGELV